MAQTWMAKSVRVVPVGEHINDHPVILAEIRLHGVFARNISKLHFETIPGPPRQKMMRAYARRHKLFTAPDGRIGLEVRCPANPEMIRQCEEALRAGTEFKMYTPKDGIRVYPDKNMLENIKAFNKRAGFQYLKGGECRGQLSTFAVDTKDGTVIMKMILI